MMDQYPNTNLVISYVPSSIHPLVYLLFVYNTANMHIITDWHLNILMSCTWDGGSGLDLNLGAQPHGCMDDGT